MNIDTETPFPIQQTHSADWLEGGNEMERLIHTMDWSRTPLGPIQSWPARLCTTVNLALHSNIPISLVWGPAHTHIYNDAYWRICGNKHLHLIGHDFTECWASAWPTIGATFSRALAGTATTLENQRVFLDRHGYLEEAFFTFSFSPVYDESGQVAGLFHTITETTGNILSQRRLRTLHDLVLCGTGTQSLDDSLHLVARTLADAAPDLPFVLVYQINDADNTAELVAHAGLAPGTPASPTKVDLTQAIVGWPLGEDATSDAPLLVDDVRERFGDLVCGPYPEPITSASIYALTPPGSSRPTFIMVAGVSTRLPMNEAYALFFDLLAATITTVIAHALARQVERQHANVVAELDQSKKLYLSKHTRNNQAPVVHRQRRAQIIWPEDIVDARGYLQNSLSEHYDKDADNGNVWVMHPPTDLRLLTDAVPALIAYIDAQKRYRFNNRTYEEWFGRARSESYGKHVAEILGVSFYEQIAQYIDAALAGQLVMHEAIIPHQDGETQYFQATYVPDRAADGQVNGFFALVQDITEHKRTEQALQCSVERLRVLADASRIFAEVGTQYQTLLDKVVRTIGESLGDWCMLQMLSGDGQEITTVAVYRGDDTEGRVQPIAATVPSPIDTIKPLWHILQGDRAQLLSTLDLAQVQSMMPFEDRSVIEQLKDYVHIVAPLRVGGRLIGLIDVLHKPCDQTFFEEDDLLLVQELADRAAMAIGNARLLQQVQHELAERAKAESEVRKLSLDLEHRVLARTAELTAANKELESFSYSVSHDLRAPLRAIDGFSDILLEEHILTLPDEAQRYLKLIRANAQQMGRLISDLLAFSRLGRQSLSRQAVDVASLVAQCLDDLQDEQRGRTIEFHLGSLPMCEADPALLKQVWLNLLANALKYTRRRDVATIDMGSQLEDGSITYFVKDNGAGFDMRYADKLFSVFQRMHRAEDYEGTGVGLAIVQRIIHRHGGRVWAEAVTQQGATFYFTLGSD